MTNESQHKIIAEIGTSHAGDIYYAKDLVDAAIESGATSIKFQWVIANEIVSKHAGKILLPSGNIDIHASFTQIEKEFDFYAELKFYTESKGLEFLCSVFGFESLDLLLKLDPSCIKIASPEVNYLELISTLQCAYAEKTSPETPTPFSIIISDGISTYIDIANAIAHLAQIPTTLLRCVTQYPAKPSDYQLSRMLQYSKIFSCTIGISDHSEDPCFIPVLATLLGSKCTEKHFTLSKDNSGLDDSFALTPTEFARMAEAIHSVDCMLDNENDLQDSIIDIKNTMQSINSNFPFSVEDVIYSKGYSATLLPIYYSTRRSLFSAQKIKKGSVFDTTNTTSLRSETNINAGISAEHFALIKGRVAQRDIEVNSPLAWQDIASYPNISLNFV